MNVDIIHNVNTMSIMRQNTKARRMGENKGKQSAIFKLETRMVISQLHALSFLQFFTRNISQ